MSFCSYTLSYPPDVLLVSANLDCSIQVDLAQHQDESRKRDAELTRMKHEQLAGRQLVDSIEQELSKCRQLLHTAQSQYSAQADKCKPLCIQAQNRAASAPLQDGILLLASLHT